MPGRDEHASGALGGRAAAPPGRRGARSRGVARALEAESDRLSLWIPVLFGGGILVYFALPEEPRLLTAAALDHGGGGAHPRGQGNWASASSSAAPHLRLPRASPMPSSTPRWPARPSSPRRCAGWSVKGFVELYERRDKAKARITLRVIALGDLPPAETPYRVRVTLSAANAHVESGEAVKVGHSTAERTLTHMAHEETLLSASGPSAVPLPRSTRSMRWSHIDEESGSDGHVRAGAGGRRRSGSRRGCPACGRAAGVRRPGRGEVRRAEHGRSTTAAAVLPGRCQPHPGGRPRRHQHRCRRGNHATTAGSWRTTPNSPTSALGRRSAFSSVEELFGKLDPARHGLPGRLWGEGIAVPGPVSRTGGHLAAR